MNVSSSGGIIKVNDAVPSSYPYTYDYDTNTTVTVEAVPSFGYTFNGWMGNLSGTTNPTTIVVDCNKSIAADFSINWNLIGIALFVLAAAVFLVNFIITRRKAD